MDAGRGRGESRATLLCGMFYTLHDEPLQTGAAGQTVTSMLSLKLFLQFANALDRLDLENMFHYTQYF